MVGIVHKVRFVTSSSKKFKSYINYIARDEATRNNNFDKFSLYNDYMSNPEKSGSLFTSTKDWLDKKGTEQLKEVFEKSQENNSIMWQDVFSFDNKWLEKNGLYDSKTHTVDETKVRNAVRAAMEELKKNENLDGLVWSASLHYNTDNIHVHIASVEINPSRERGKRKPKTLINMKSKLLNNLIDRQAEYSKINDIIRKNIIEQRRDTDFFKDKEIKKMLKDIIKDLPEDHSLWKYNNNCMNDIRPKLDKLTKYYIENYKKDDYEELIKELNKGEKFLKESYGEGEKFRYKDYKENKINDLYTRMGNSILSELRINAKEKERLEARKKFVNNLRKNTNTNTLNIRNKDVNRIKNAMRDDVNHAKNQSIHRQLESEYEYFN